MGIVVPAVGAQLKDLVKKEVARREQLAKSGVGIGVELLSGNEPELLSDNTAELLSRNVAKLMSGNKPKVLSENSPALLSGNEAELLSGNKPEILSGNEAELLSENKATILSGNRVSVLSGIKLEVHISESGNNNGNNGPLPGAPPSAPQLGAPGQRGPGGPGPGAGKPAMPPRTNPHDQSGQSSSPLREAARHLLAAADNVQSVGLVDLAGALRKEASTLDQRAREAGESGGKVQAARDLQEELKRLRRDLDAMRREMRERGGPPRR